jgi:hypothetical protein
MTIVLNHTVVPVGDRRRGAQLLAGLLGVEAGEPVGPFAPVRVNDDLTHSRPARRVYARAASKTPSSTRNASWPGRAPNRSSKPSPSPGAVARVVAPSIVGACR